MPKKPHETAAMHAGIKNLNNCTFHGFNLPAGGEVSTTAGGILHPCKSSHQDVCPRYHFFTSSTGSGKPFDESLLKVIIAFSGSSFRSFD